MSGIRDTVFHIVAGAVVVAWGWTPASAIEVAAHPDEPQSRTLVIAADQTRGAVPGGALAAAPTLQRKPKAARAASRRATVAHRYGDCSGAWCGRQFVLMVGVGY